MRFSPFSWYIGYIVYVCVAYCLAYTKLFRGEKPVVINSIGWSLAYLSILLSIIGRFAFFKRGLRLKYSWLFNWPGSVGLHWRYFLFTLFSPELSQVWEKNIEYLRCDRMLELHISSKGHNLCVNHQHEDDSGLCRFYVWSRKVTFHYS